MAVPVRYRKNASPIIATYQYRDVANGLGIVAFNAYDARIGADTSYALSSETVYSHDIITNKASEDTSGDGVPHTIHDLNFFTTFNSPRTVKGNAFISLPHSISSVAGKYVKSYPIVTIYKNDGTTSTSIGSASGALIEQSDAGTTVKQQGVQIALTETLFKKGDEIIVNVQTWQLANTASGSVDLGHDPQARTAVVFGTDTTKCTINIPFRIDL